MFEILFERFFPDDEMTMVIQDTRYKIRVPRSFENRREISPFELSFSRNINSYRTNDNMKSFAGILTLLCGLSCTFTETRAGKKRVSEIPSNQRYMKIMIFPKSFLVATKGLH